MKEKYGQHGIYYEVLKPTDMVEGNLPIFDTTPKNVPQRLWEASKLLENLRARRDAIKRRRT